MAKTTKPKETITKADLKKSFWRNLLGLQMGWNYESMQGVGYCFAMMPALKKLYPDQKQLSEAMKTHLAFFNTTPAMSHLIVGANIAIEEQVGQSDRDGVIGFKAGLMGPFAGIGDTVFVAIYRAIVFSIAASFALQGNWIGIPIVIICALGIWYVRYLFTQIGYKQGHKVATDSGGLLKRLTEAASILGLTVVGGMIVTTVTAAFRGNYAIPLIKMDFAEKVETVEGGVAVIARNLQDDLLDRLMPALLPLGIVFFAFWLLGKKKMNSNKLIWILFGSGIVLGNIGNIINSIMNGTVAGFLMWK